MWLLIAQSVFVYCFFLVVWPFLRHLVVKTDLDNIPGPPSETYLKGNFAQIFNPLAWTFHQDIAEQFGRIIKINGPFGQQQLYVFDSKALHHILVKDQHIFEETRSFFAANGLIFGNGLLSSTGDTHRKQRKMMNPVFSINHMRHMIPMFYDVAHKLRTAIQLKLKDGPQEVDLLQWMTRAALEMVGQSGLGYSFDPLVEGKHAHQYSRSVNDLMPTLFTLNFERKYLLPALVKIGSPRFRRYIIDWLPWKNLRKLRDIVDVMDQTTVSVLNSKKKALQEGEETVVKQVGGGNDIISILMKANMEASEADRLPDSEVLGQMSTLIFAAMDTTSNALSRILYLLAGRPEIQTKLRQEVIEARNKLGDIPHDELVVLPYMDAVCRETLRLYPPATTVVRTAREDVVLPLSAPIKGIDGREIHQIAVPKNTDILVSILNANRDPTLWGPDSYEWKPERWMAPLPDAVIDARMPGVYSHLLTFLAGGRACIGFKFSQLEMKVVLSVLISQFRFSLSKEEIVWEMGPVATPTVKGEAGQRLPLIVELVDPVIVA